MSAQVATCPAPPPPTSPPPPLDDYAYDEQPKIYISSARLELKRTQDVTAVASDAYEWHTKVVLPAVPPSPEPAPVPVEEEITVSKQSQQPVEAINPHTSKNRYTPATTYAGDKPSSKGLATTLMDFMAVERYHSELNMLEAGVPGAARAGQRETTDV